jgi:probable F420-dependent oxidoreductase
MDSVRRAEAAGCSVVTVTDHFDGGGGIFGSLVSAYDAAPSMRVGTLMINNDLWNPCVLAREVISADILTEGHFELGIGAGWDDADYRAVGALREPAAQRIERLAEAVSVLRQAFAGGPVQHEGRYYSADTGPWPRPHQADIPIVVGGGGRRILELAAREADVVSVHRNLEHGVADSWKPQEAPGFPDEVSERVSWIRSAAGPRFNDLELHTLVYKVVVTSSPGAAASELGAALGLAPGRVLASPHFLVGDVEAIADQLLTRRERWGNSYLTLVDASDVGALAPVIDALVGA